MLRFFSSSSLLFPVSFLEAAVSIQEHWCTKSGCFLYRYAMMALGILKFGEYLQNKITVDTSPGWFNLSPMQRVIWRANWKHKDYFFCIVLDWSAENLYKMFLELIALSASFGVSTLNWLSCLMSFLISPSFIVLQKKSHKRDSLRWPEFAIIAKFLTIDLWFGFLEHVFKLLLKQKWLHSLWTRGR